MLDWFIAILSKILPGIMGAKTPAQIDTDAAQAAHDATAKHPPSGVAGVVGKATVIK